MIKREKRQRIVLVRHGESTQNINPNGGYLM